MRYTGSVPFHAVPVAVKLPIGFTAYGDFGFGNIFQSVQVMQVRRALQRVVKDHRLVAPWPCVQPVFHT